MRLSGTKAALWSGLAVGVCLANEPVVAQNTPITREQFLQLQSQNEQLRLQLQKQQALIDSLSKKVSEIQDLGSRRDQELDSLKSGMKDTAETPPSSSFHFGNISLSGEGSVAFFDSQTRGQTPHPQFRVDEARLFLDAQVWTNVYFFSELDLATHENTDLALTVAELYLDFENVSKLWNRDRMLNVRAGRFYTPFGEEYQGRFAIDNPLISHSVSDIWGSDDGAEIYGTLGPFQYALAVQNGGASSSIDLNNDKAVSGRIGYDPAKWLHLSVSGMRTGDLEVKNENLSAIWFGSGFFRSIGSSQTTEFHTDLVEGDVQVRLPHTQFKTAGGYIHYDDNDPQANNQRDIYYYYLEGVQDFTRKIYAAARFSEVFAPNGFHVVGNGPMGEYLFTPGVLTTDYWRLSMGLGYRFSPNLVVKGEYSFNRGHELDGSVRNYENVFALEAAYKF